MHAAIYIGVALLGLYFYRKGATARAIRKTGDRTVWSQAADTRFPRIPRSSFGRRKGLK